VTKPPSAPARAGISPSFNALDIADDVAEHRHVTNGHPVQRIITAGGVATAMSPCPTNPRMIIDMTGSPHPLCQNSDICRSPASPQARTLIFRKGNSEHRPNVMWVTNEVTFGGEHDRTDLPHRVYA
jgi:hypothetical protein